MMGVSIFPSTGGGGGITGANSPLEVSGSDVQVISKATLLSYANVEDGADVTDATNVNSAGAVMESDTSTASMSFVIDEDDLSTDSATKVPTQQSVKAYIDSGLTKLTGINTQTGTTYTGVLSDGGKAITMDNASANTLTIPANSSVAYDVGTMLNIIQLGAGQTTIAINTDTLNSNNGTKISGQYGVATALKVTSTSWVLMGDLTT